MKTAIFLLCSTPIVIGQVNIRTNRNRNSVTTVQRGSSTTTSNLGAFTAGQSFPAGGFGSFLNPPPQDSTPPPVEEEGSIERVQGRTRTTVREVNGRRVFRRRFVAKGTIDRICVNIDDNFCNVEGNDESAFISCYAARRALSRASGGYAFEGSLRVRTNRQGRINAIDLNAKAAASALAISFGETGANSQSGSRSKSKAGGRASVILGELGSNGSGLAQAAGLATSDSQSDAVSVAFAKSLSSAGSGAVSAAEVKVRGNRIRLFEGNVAAAAGAFALSETDSKALAQSATRAYSDAIVYAQQQVTVNDTTIEEEGLTFQYLEANSSATAFGDLVAKAVSTIGVAFTFDTSVTQNDEDGVDIDFKVGDVAGGFATVICSDEEEEKK